MSEQQAPPLTIGDFLEARWAERDHPSQHEEDCQSYLRLGCDCVYGELRAHIAAGRAILEFHKQWPVLVDTPPKLEPIDETDLSSMSFRMTQQIQWMTEQQYRERFGDEPPTTPIVRALASVYRDHPDFRQEWL